MRRISIFGATGSVGCQTVELIRAARGAGGPAACRVVAVTGGQNIARLAGTARELGAELAVTADPALLSDLRAALAGSGVEAAAGTQALLEAADRPADWVMSAIVGVAGLAPGMRALRHGATLALANKESLVAAGGLMLARAARHGGRILPVDSEHSAIFQALGAAPVETVARLTLTASGGALRDWPLERLASATVADAARHPNWAMGKRITVDSASMFNKAMEMIEARELFGVAPGRIEVVLHRESIVHSLVAFHDGATLAHLGAPDMRHAIGFALNWPERRPLPVAPLDLVALGRLSFEAPDPARYPALALAREVMRLRGGAGAAFNAAKEVALDHFLGGSLRFTDMAGLVEGLLDRLAGAGALAAEPGSLDDVLELDGIARALAHDMARARAGRRAG